MSTLPDIHLSVIIPAYNESGRIRSTLAHVLDHLKKQTYASEIIVVDDGSSDDTVAVASELLRHFPHLILKNGRNHGKGYSVKQGMLAGKGKYLLFTDADMSTPIEEVERFIALLQKDYDVVIGSRALRDSKIEVRQNFLRELMGKTFNRLARALAFGGISDSQCGFKAFRNEVGRDLFSRQKLEGFIFDAEILFLAQRQHYRIREEPVIWRNSPQSRVRIVEDSLGMFLDLVKIRWIHRR